MDLSALVGDPSTAISILFVIFLCLFFWRRRHQIEIQSVFWPFLYMILYKTQVGLRWMSSVARRFPGILWWMGWIATIGGFGGMALILYILLISTRDIFLSPTAVAGIMPVLPIDADGVFFVRFDYWIICIFAILVVHEFSHGIMARRYGVPVKSSGLAALGIIVPIIPGAFVEPDEAELAKRRPSEQLAVFSAGPFANILTAIMVMLALTAIAPAVSDMIWTQDGVSVANITAGGPADLAGIGVGDRIIALEDTPVKSMEEFTAALADHGAGETVKLYTNRTAHTLTLGAKDDGSALLGVMAKGHLRLTEGFQGRAGEFIAGFVEWVFALLYNLAMLNLGIGLFNLLPLWVVDGGRMLLTALQGLLPKRSALLTWHIISACTLVMVLMNVFGGFLK